MARRPIVVRLVDHNGREREPTRADRRAIAQAVAAGKVKNGDTIAIEYRRTNPTDAEEAYTAFHWGNAPRRRRNAKLPDYSELYALGKLRAVEYQAEKGKTDAIWVHEFSAPYPTLTATADGKLGPIVGGGAFVTSRGIER
ncbi:MAG: hypothetical protein GY953_47615 [bacterium]|nr:hypothetical protein [bacterium]